MKPFFLLLKARDAHDHATHDLLAVPTPVKGHTRDGAPVRPYVARRHHKATVARDARPMAAYHQPQTTPLAGDALISAALAELESRLRKPGAAFSTPGDAKSYVRLHLAEQEHESFCVMWLDHRNQLIAFEELFRGTVNGTAVYPREVVKRALQINAAAVILVHNHPSGVAEPSSADNVLTSRLKDALSIVEVRIIDHLVVGSHDVVSFSERGIL